MISEATGMVAWERTLIFKQATETLLLPVSLKRTVSYFQAKHTAHLPTPTPTGPMPQQKVNET